MEDRTDYKCYLLGCQGARIEPLEEWRFQMLREHSVERPVGSPIPLFVLERLAILVAEGRKVAAGGGDEEDEPGAAACGVREPRAPLEPVLTGAAARSLPSADAPDQSFWRT